MTVVRSRWSVVKVLQRFALGAMLLALSFAAQAQQPARVPRIGFLSAVGSAQQPHVEAFRQGLRDLGYVEGKNIAIEWRHSGGKLVQLLDVAAELVGLKVDLIVASRTPSINAAKRATKSIPIVMVGASDPVGTGIIKSLARPGGNLTGLSDLV